MAVFTGIKPRTFIETSSPLRNNIYERLDLVIYRANDLMGWTGRSFCGVV